MIRALEIALFLAPFGLFAAWRIFVPDTEIGPKHLTVAGLVLALCLGALVWTRMQDGEPPSAAYVPAHLSGGAIEPATTRP